MSLKVSENKIKDCNLAAEQCVKFSYSYLNIFRHKIDWRELLSKLWRSKMLILCDAKTLYLY